MGEWREINGFWSAKPEGDGHGDVREFWFSSAPNIDRQIKGRLVNQYHLAAAAAAGFADWKLGVRGLVALIALLDQVSRNVFRRGGKSIVADPLAPFPMAAGSHE